MAAVSLQGLGKFYGQQQVVNNLNLEIADGSFTVLVGPSGCGKSTTLRMIAGLEDIDQGRLWIDGQDVTHLPPQQRDIAMVFQSYALYPHMSAYKNMAFGLLKTTALPKREIDARVRQAAEKLSISALLDKKPADLSGGERQRVAMGRALVRQPKVFLFDEPLSNLDAKLRQRMRTELRKLQEELAITVIYVTHDQVEAMTLGDQVAIMNQGQLQQADAPMTLYRRPANMFVASFIGTPEMNFIPCQVYEESGCSWLRHGQTTVSVPSHVQAHAELMLGVRAEEIRLAEGGPADVSGVVQRVELLGADALAEIRMGEHDLTVRFPIAHSPRAGQSVGLMLDRSQTRLFDARTGHMVWAP